MSPRSSRLAALVIVALAASCTRPSIPRVLRVELPLTRNAVLVTDVDFCRQLRPTFRFTRAGSGELAIDSALVQSAENPCVFVMDQPVDVTRGTYDAEVRFTANDDRGTCDGVVGEIVVGVFSRAGIVIDENNGLAPFEDIGEFDTAFDPDGDGIENYDEVRAGADPCQAGTAPDILATVTADPDPREGDPIFFDVVMSNEDGADFLMNLEIAQSSDPLGTPLAVFRSRTDSPSLVEDPELTRPPDSEAWAFNIISAVDDGPGGATWRVSFTPEEPFVGPLEIRVFASFGATAADVFAETVFQQTLNITEVPDDTQLRFVEVNGAGDEVLLVRDAVSFREVGPGVTPDAREFVLSNGDQGTDEETWDIVLPQVALDAGVVLARAGGIRWRLTWNPDNAIFLANPAGLLVSLTLVDDSNPAPVSLTLNIAPLFNDAPSIVPPSVGARSLPPAPFVSHTMPFSVDDPDQIDTAPTCAASVAPRGATTCTTAFSSISCGVAGPRVGSTWPMEAVLTASATYEADCGTAPSFTLTVDVTDAVVPGSEPAVTQSASVTDLALQTTQSIQPGTVTAPFSFTGAGLVFIDPNIDGLLPSRTGLGVVVDGAGDPVLALYDLDLPEIVFTFERDLTDNVCPNPINPDIERHEGVVDIVNHRALLYTRDCASDANLAVIVDLTTRTTTSVLFGDVCELFNDRLSNPSVDENGDFWFGCDTGSDTLVRLQPDGTFTAQDVGLGTGINAFEHHAYYRDAGGTPWYVWPDQDGVHLIDTSDHANLTPTVVDLPWPVASFTADDIEDHLIDLARDDVLFTYARSGATDEVFRVSFDGAPVLEGPLVLPISSGSSGGLGARLLLKRSDAGQAGTDLVISGGGDDLRPHIDLDTFTLTGERGGSCTQDPECLMPGETCFLASNICSDFFDTVGAELFASPDRRFMVYPIDDSDVGRGAWLYGWEPDSPRSFLELGVPSGFEQSQFEISVSNEGFLMVIPDGDRVEIFYFVEAEAGLDQ